MTAPGSELPSQRPLWRAGGVVGRDRGGYPLCVSCLPDFVGLLELAKQLGNVSQPAKVYGLTAATR